jgi:hypothetical protein
MFSSTEEPKGFTSSTSVSCRQLIASKALKDVSAKLVSTGRAIWSGRCLQMLNVAYPLELHVPSGDGLISLLLRRLGQVCQHFFKLLLIASHFSRSFFFQMTRAGANSPAPDDAGWRRTVALRTLDRLSKVIAYTSLFEREVRFLGENEAKDAIHVDWDMIGDF